jgi:hypothetical protein
MKIATKKLEKVSYNLKRKKHKKYCNTRIKIMAKAKEYVEFRNNKEEVKKTRTHKNLEQFLID